MTDLFDKEDVKDAEIAALKQQVANLKLQVKGKDPDAKPMSWYQEMRKKDPHKYLTTAFQMQMDRDSQTLGVDFFDTNDPLPRTREYQRYDGPNAIKSSALRD